jgi:hypothetical protein
VIGTLTLTNQERASQTPGEITRLRPDEDGPSLEIPIRN